MPQRARQQGPVLSGVSLPRLPPMHGEVIPAPGNPDPCGLGTVGFGLGTAKCAVALMEGQDLLRPVS
jgi:hypothetical protein